MSRLLEKLLHGFGKLAIALIVAALLLFSVLSAAGAFMYLTLAQYGMAAAFGYGLCVFVAALVLIISTLRRKEPVSLMMEGAWFFFRMSAGTVVGLFGAFCALMIGMDPAGLGPLMIVVACSVLVFAVLQ